MLHRFREIRDRFVGVPVFDPFPDTMVQVALQNDLPNLMQGAFGRIDLNQDILAGNILVDHFIDRLKLPDDFIQASMQVIGIHTLPHGITSRYPQGYSIILP